MGKLKRTCWESEVSRLIPAVEKLAWKKPLARRSRRKTSVRPIGASLRLSAEAARQGMEMTTPLVARKGRASYLGERSAGHQDPGATSSFLILNAAADTWANR